MPFTLASAGEVVHIWDIQTAAASPSVSTTGGLSSLPQLVVPTHASTSLLGVHTGSVLAVQWNHNHTVLATGGADGSVGLSGVVDGKVILRLPAAVAPSDPPVTAIGLSSGSRYLVSAAGSALGLWDLKRPEKAPKGLHGHVGTVHALDLGVSDTMVASVGASGAILLHTLNPAALAATLTTKDAAPLSDVQWSGHRAGTLATTGEAGVVQVWDTQASTLVTSLRPTSAAAGGSPLSGTPLTALRFSTTSPNLLAAVGGQRLCFFDVASKKCIRDIGTDYTLTCLDYHADGCSLVIGTQAGHVLMYDIRAASKPTAKILHAHAAPVNAVKFQRDGPGGPKKPTTAAAAPAAPAEPSGRAQPSQSHNHTLPAHSAFSHTTALSQTNSTLNLSSASLTNQTAPASSLQLQLPLSHQQQASTSDAFSPIRSSPTAQSTPFGQALGGGHMNASTMGVTMRDGLVSPIGAGSTYAADPSLLLTPVAGASAGGWSQQLSSAMSGAGQQQASDRMSATAPVQPPAHLISTFGARHAPAAATTATTTTTQSTYSQPMDSPGGRNYASTATAASSSSSSISALHSIQPSTTHTQASSGASSSSPRRSRSPLLLGSSLLQELPSTKKEQSLIQSPMRRSGGGGGGGSFSSSPLGPSASAFAGASPPGAGAGASAAGLSDYQVSLLKSMLDESLYSLRTEFSHRVNDLHMEMVKQFHLAQLEHQRSMDQLVDKFATMIDEVKDLREDYKSLRHMY